MISLSAVSNLPALGEAGGVIRRSVDTPIVCCELGAVAPDAGRPTGVGGAVPTFGNGASVSSGFFSSEGASPIPASMFDAVVGARIDRVSQLDRGLARVCDLRRDVDCRATARPVRRHGTVGNIRQRHHEATVDDLPRST
jgi:hypothetical protein